MEIHWKQNKKSQTVQQWKLYGTKWKPKPQNPEHFHFCSFLLLLSEGIGSALGGRVLKQIIIICLTIANVVISPRPVSLNPSAAVPTVFWMSAANCHSTCSLFHIVLQFDVCGQRPCHTNFGIWKQLFGANACIFWTKYTQKAFFLQKETRSYYFRIIYTLRIPSSRLSNREKGS